MSQRKRRREDQKAVPIDWQDGASVPLRTGQPLWDFAAARAAGGGEAAQAEPSPAQELERARLVARLRQRYAEACKDLLFLAKPPADSMDRWMLEQLAQPRSEGDPLFPKPGIGETSQVLLRELLAEVPMRCPTRAFGAVAFEALERYVASAGEWLQRLGAPQELEQAVKELRAWLEEHREGARARRNPAECPLRKKLHELGGSGGLSSRFRSRVEPKALQVVAIVSNEARDIVAAMLKSERGTKEEGEIEIEEQDERAVAVKFREDAIRLSKMHFLKLRKLHEAKHQGSSSEDEFLRSLYVMLRRYVTFIGLDPAVQGLQGGNMHAAAPESVFQWLKQELEVGSEMFASPLNCYFPSFCSAFPDVDTAFGSLGSFFQLKTLAPGSYEVGPPYTEEVLELTARRLLQLLRAAHEGGEELSFVLFVPDWEGCGGLELLGGPDFTAFNRCHSGQRFLMAEGREHCYISGVQFFADVGADAARRYYVVPHGTRVYLLQTDAGAKRWPLTEARQRALLENMRPKS